MNKTKILLILCLIAATISSENIFAWNPIKDIKEGVKHVAKEVKKGLRKITKPIVEEVVKIKADFRVERQGPFTITGVPPNRIHVTVPIGFSVRARKDLLVEKLSVSTDGTVNLALTTSLSIDENWNVRSNTQAKYSWIKKPEIGLFHITNIQISGLANDLIERQLPTLARKFDEEIQKELNLRSVLDKFWKQMHDPVKITQNPNDPPIWLKVKPASIYISDLQTNANTIDLTGSLSAVLDATAGAKPASVPLTSLPKKLSTKPNARGFNVRLPVYLQYGEIESFLKEKIKKETLGTEKVDVAINDVRIRGKGDDLIIGADLVISAKNKPMNFKGWLMLSLKPIIQGQSIRIEDGNTEANASILAKIYGEVIGRNLAEEFKLDIQEKFDAELTTAKAELSKLANTNIYNLGRLNGKIDKLAIEKIEITSKGVVLTVKANGNISVQIDAFQLVKL